MPPLTLIAARQIAHKLEHEGFTLSTTQKVLDVGRGGVLDEGEEDLERRIREELAEQGITHG